MTTLPHTHETGECLACDFADVRAGIGGDRMPSPKEGADALAALDRISTALATTREAQLEQQRWEIWSTMQLNVDPDLHGQAMRHAATAALATSQARVTELEEDREHLEEGARLLLAVAQGCTELTSDAWDSHMAGWLETERARKAKQISPAPSQVPVRTGMPEASPEDSLSVAPLDARRDGVGEDFPTGK